MDFLAVLKRDWDGLTEIDDFLGGGKVCKRAWLHHWLTCLTLTVAFCWILSSESELWKWEFAFTSRMSDWQKANFLLLELKVDFAGGEEGFGEEQEWEKLSGHLEDVWLYLWWGSVTPARQKATEGKWRKEFALFMSGMSMIMIVVMKKNVT